MLITCVVWGCAVLLKPTMSTTVRNLGVVIDSKLSLSSHVVALCRSGFYHLCQLHPVLRSLKQEAARTLVQAFISSLDYCNSLLYGLPQSLISKVQSVQNAAARLLTETRWGDHISPVLCPWDVSTSSWHVLFTHLCLARHFCTWLTTYTWFQKVQDVDSARPPTDRVLLHGRTTHLVTEALLPPGHVFGTASQYTCVMKT